MKKILLSLLFIVLIACNKETKTATVAIDSTNTDSIVAAPQNSVSKDKLTERVNNLVRLTETTKQQLKTATPQQANELYEAFVKEITAEVAQINNLEHNIVDDYWAIFYDENGNEKILPDSISKKVQILKKAGLRFTYIGEGFGDIQHEADLFKKLFEHHVTPDYREFIRLSALDDSELYSSDAGIIIPWHKVADRVLNWENFMLKYPDSPLLSRAKEYYLSYQDGYLLGMDNTPTIEFSDNTVYPEILEEFKRFIAKYPQSPTTELVKIVMNHKGSSTDLYDAIKKGQHLLPQD